MNSVVFIAPWDDYLDMIAFNTVKYLVGMK